MEEQKKIRFGVVGLGRGLDVIRDVLTDEDVELVAVCDIQPAKIERAKKILKEEAGIEKIETFLDYEEFLKADTEVVIIATDAVMHVPFVVRALDAGKNVISEIPAVNSLEEAKILKKAVESHPGQKYFCAENVCYLGYIQAWKKMYEAGKFGDIVYAEAEYLHAIDFRTATEANLAPVGHWRNYNPCIKYCTHELGPLLWIMDDKPVSVTCMVPDARYNLRKEASYAENAVMLVKTAKGAVIRVLICFGAFVGCTHNYALYGTRGTVESDKSKKFEDSECYARFSDLPLPIDDDKIHLPINARTYSDGKGKSHLGFDRMMMRAFIDCVKNGKEPPIGVDLAIRMALAGIYAHESYLQGGSAVAIPDPEDF